MERKKASDFPQELLSLFDTYVHGGMNRRALLGQAGEAPSPLGAPGV